MPSPRTPAHARGKAGMAQSSLASYHAKTTPCIMHLPVPWAWGQLKDVPWFWESSSIFVNTTNKWTSFRWCYFVYPARPWNAIMNACLTLIDILFNCILEILSEDYGHTHKNRIGKIGMWHHCFGSQLSLFTVDSSCWPPPYVEPLWVWPHTPWPCWHRSSPKSGVTFMTCKHDLSHRELTVGMWRSAGNQPQNAMPLFR